MYPLLYLLSSFDIRVEYHNDIPYRSQLFVKAQVDCNNYTTVCYQSHKHRAP